MCVKAFELTSEKIRLNYGKRLAAYDNELRELYTRKCDLQKQILDIEQQEVRTEAFRQELYLEQQREEVELKEKFYKEEEK